MISLVVLCSILVSTVVAQGNSVLVQVQASGNSEDVVSREQAIANAVADASKALSSTPCKDVELQAQAEARKVVEAAATATAASQITVQTRGRGEGVGAANVEAVSSATAIAEAVAEAIAIAVNGATATGKTDAVKQVKQTARAVVQQQVISRGDAEAVISALASSTVFVQAVATALAQAFANCDIASVQVVASAEEVPAPIDLKFAQTDALVNVFGSNGFLSVLQNQANAFTPQSTSSNNAPSQGNQNSSPPLASPQTPTPAGGVAISGDVFSGSAQGLVNVIGQLGA